MAASKKSRPQPPPSVDKDELLPPLTKSSKKYPPPPQQPTPASSSSEEEESESDEEQPTENNGTPLKPPPNPQPLPQTTASESEEDESDDEEEEEGKTAPFASQPPSATKSQPKEQSFAKTDASESSESDSDEPLASQPTKMKGTQEPSASRKLFQRVWTADDEVTLLKRLLEYKNLHGKEPSSPAKFDAFHEFVKDSLDAKLSRAQLASKTKNLRRKFGTNLDRMEKGGEIVGKEHEQLCFELSKKLWGAEGGKAGEEEDVATVEKKSGRKRKGKELPKVDVDASSRKKSSTSSDVAKVDASRKKIKSDAEPWNTNVATTNGAFTAETKVDVGRPQIETVSGVISHRFLINVVDQIDDSLKNVGEHGWLKAQMVHLKPETLMSLERKCIDQYRNELKVNRLRNRLHATVIKALEEEGFVNGPSSDSVFVA